MEEKQPSIQKERGTPKNARLTFPEKMGQILAWISRVVSLVSEKV